jgi:hypothetical protein
MPARTFPNLGLKAGYDIHESGWGDDMTLNILKLSILAQGRVDDIVAAEPGAPVQNDVVILDETHATHPNEIAAYDNGAWVYVAPIVGWQMYNDADGDRYEFTGAVWEELVVSGGGGSGVFSGARIRNSAAFAPAVAANTDATAPIDEEVFDTDGYCDLATNPGRITIIEDGYYMLAAQMRRSASVADQFLVMIRQYDSVGALKNQFYGGDVESGGGDAGQCVTGPVYGAAGDYFVLRYFVTLAGDMDIRDTWLSIIRLAAPAALSSTSVVMTDADDYTVLSAHDTRYIRLTGAGAKNIVVELNSTEALPDNGEWHFRNVGAGDATFVPAGGVTINPPAGGSLVIPQDGTATLKRVAVDEFDLMGLTVAAP